MRTVFQGNGGLRNPHQVLNYTSAYNSEGRGIIRMDRKHCVIPFQREEVFHELCNIYKDRKIAYRPHQQEEIQFQMRTPFESHPHCSADLARHLFQFKVTIIK